MNKYERFRNAFYAQAVCDAVGDPFEFDSDINYLDVLEYAQCEKFIEITDDTQMALFIAEVMPIVMYLDLSSVGWWLGQSYIAWFETQQSVVDHAPTYSRLQVMPEANKRKSPGDTCMFSCLDLKNGEPVSNNSKGCGSVMRILPFVWLDDNIRGTELALLSADITHKHPENAEAVKYLMAIYYHAKNDFLIPFEVEGDFTHISDIGEGWTALEAVQMAHWAVTKATTFDELLTYSIAHDGDSDSVAAIAGSIWGLLGREVPVKYIEKIAEKKAIDYVLNLPFYREPDEINY
jgi:ADP-ribosylglycohydrolase